MYEIIIIRKNIKSINIRVKSSRTVIVTAPYRSDEEYVKNIIRKHKRWIDGAAKKAAEKEKLEKTFDPCGELLYLGKRYKIKICYENEENVEILENTATVYITSHESEKNLTNIIKEWKMAQCKRICLEFIGRYKKIMNKEVTAVRLKKMSTRWGSCNPYKGYINLNAMLIEKPVECIEYVVVHELAHLTYPNHSREFWNYVALYLPEWKDLRKKLNE